MRGAALAPAGAPAPPEPRREPAGAPTAQEDIQATAEEDFLPADLRVPSSDELTGLLMRFDKPLVVDGEVRTCRECGAYREWVVLLMGDNVWLRCGGGHETFEPRLDATWYNRNSGPMTGVHSGLDDALRALGPRPRGL